MNQCRSWVWLQCTRRLQGQEPALPCKQQLLLEQLHRAKLFLPGTNACRPEVPLMKQLRRLVSLMAVELAR